MSRLRQGEEGEEGRMKGEREGLVVFGLYSDWGCWHDMFMGVVRLDARTDCTIHDLWRLELTKPD